MGLAQSLQVIGATFHALALETNIEAEYDWAADVPTVFVRNPLLATTLLLFRLMGADWKESEEFELLFLLPPTRKA